MIRRLLNAAMWAVPVTGALIAAFAGTGFAAAATSPLDFRGADDLVSRIGAGYGVQTGSQTVGRLDARVREQAAADDRMLNAFLERTPNAAAQGVERAEAVSMDGGAVAGPAPASERAGDTGAATPQGPRSGPSQGADGLPGADGAAHDASATGTGGGSGTGGSGSAPADPGAGSGGGSAPADPGAGSGGGSAPADPGAGSGGGSAPADPGGGAPSDPGGGGGGGGGKP